MIYIATGSNNNLDARIEKGILSFTKLFLEHSKPNDYFADNLVRIQCKDWAYDGIKNIIFDEIYPNICDLNPNVISDYLRKNINFLHHICEKEYSGQEFEFIYPAVIKAFVESASIAKDLSMGILDYSGDSITSHQDRVTLWSLAYHFEIEGGNPNFDEIDVVDFGGKSHDIGKVCIPSKILLKPKLNQEEWELIQTHAIKGYIILKEASLSGKYSTIPIITRDHHKNHDGTGYPQTTIDWDFNDAVLLFAQTLTKEIRIGDSFDAQIHKRVYNEQKSPKEAWVDIKQRKGWYDPQILHQIEIRFNADNSYNLMQKTTDNIEIQTREMHEKRLKDIEESTFYKVLHNGNHSYPHINRTKLAVDKYKKLLEEQYEEVNGIMVPKEHCLN